MFNTPMLCIQLFLEVLTWKKMTKTLTALPTSKESKRVQYIVGCPKLAVISEYAPLRLLMGDCDGPLIAGKD
jgi:hypothetical protein